jgi:FtsP/CotA-like multicopper oxidase with cupredoxin domain
MALDDYFESEVAIAVAAAAVVLSPRVRNVARQGAVYGLAGVLMAGDAIGSFARGIGRGVQQAANTATEAAGTATHTDTQANGSSPARGAGPDSADAAADELAAVARASAGDTAASRRSRRPRAEQIEGADNE